MNRVQFEASQVMISETQSNDIYMTVLMRMFSTRPNRNGYAVSEGMDVKAENVASAIAELDYAALIAEANKVRKNEVKPTVAAYALTSGLTVKGEYGDLLEKA